MIQSNVFMHVARTSRSPKVLHTLAVYCITLVSLTRKSLDGLAWPTVSWTRSTQYMMSISVETDKKKKSFRSQMILEIP